MKLQRGGFSVISLVQALVKVEPYKRIMALSGHVSAAMDLPLSLSRSRPLRRGFDWFIVCRHSNTVPAARHAQWWDCARGWPNDSCPWLLLGSPIGDYRPQTGHTLKNRLWLIVGASLKNWKNPDLFSLLLLDVMLFNKNPVFRSLVFFISFGAPEES